MTDCGLEAAQKAGSCSGVGWKLLRSGLEAAQKWAREAVHRKEPLTRGAGAWKGGWEGGGGRVWGLAAWEGLWPRGGSCFWKKIGDSCWQKVVMIGGGKVVVFLEERRLGA